MKGIRRFGAIARVLTRHGYGNVIDHLFKTNKTANDKDAKSRASLSDGVSLAASESA